MNEINKAMGSNASPIRVLSDVEPYDIVSTSSLSLDHAIGIGGLPMRRVIEFIGDPGSGKTTLALSVANEVLNTYPDGAVLYIDIENRLEINWVKKFVKDIDRFVVSQPEDAEEAVDLYRKAARTGMFRLIIWDSIGGAPTRAAFAKEAEKGVFAGNSQIITHLARYAQSLTNKYNHMFIGINQERVDMSGYLQLTGPGGKAWVYACSVRVHVKRGPKSTGTVYMIDESDKQVKGADGKPIPIGYQVFTKIVKSSVGSPGRVGEYWFYNQENKYGFGIDHVDEVSRLAIATGVVERAGGWLRHPLIPNGQINGQSKFLSLLNDEPDLLRQFSELTSQIMKSGAVDMSEIVPMTDPDIMLSDEESPRQKTLQQLKDENN